MQQGLCCLFDRLSSRSSCLSSSAPTAREGDSDACVGVQTSTYHGAFVGARSGHISSPADDVEHGRCADAHCSCACSQPPGRARASPADGELHHSMIHDIREKVPLLLAVCKSRAKTKWAQMEVGRLRRAVKLSSQRPVSSSGTSTVDAAESYGFSDRLPVVAGRLHAPVLLSSPPLTLSPRIPGPAHDMHLRSPGTDRCAYRCPLAGARCPGTSSARAAPSWCLSPRPGAHRLRFAPL